MTYTIRIDAFEGPFDLLLFFIERDELDIYEGEKYEVGINHMFDLTEEELNKMTGYHPNQKKSKKTSSYKPQRKGSTIPETLNWKD